MLKTEINNVKNVSRYIIGGGTRFELPNIINKLRTNNSFAIYFIDHFFSDKLHIIGDIGICSSDVVYFISTCQEPTTEFVDTIYEELSKISNGSCTAIIGIGGGVTMDVAKAISNLMTNGGKAHQYQGWDLVKKPGTFKVAIPTISGTGAEATRTCVLTDKSKGIKLGMNSQHSVFDQVIMDSDLSKTVPREQYFFTGMDSYIHCVESLAGSYRNPIGDAFSRETLALCRKVFMSEDMMSDTNRELLMVASYLGGCSIATSYVGLIHPFSAGLSVVMGTHHCIANCIVMMAMDEYYPNQVQEFKKIVSIQKIKIPSEICKNLTNLEFEKLYESTIIHEKPLTNALGSNFRAILTKQKVIEIFKKI